jgi:hypothetical protein
MAYMGYNPASCSISICRFIHTSRLLQRNSNLQKEYKYSAIIFTYFNIIEFLTSIRKQHFVAVTSPIRWGFTGGQMAVLRMNA